MKKAGVGLVVVSFMLLLYTSLAAPAYARSHQYLGPAMLAEYAAPWPVALAWTVAVAGIVLALVPLRRGERWALWTLLAMFVIPIVTRITTDPRCLVVLDPHQHGCHTFMIAALLGVVGLGLAWR
jgi:nicotinamide riboside transporter PnuC